MEAHKCQLEDREEEREEHHKEWHKEQKECHCLVTMQRQQQQQQVAMCLYGFNQQLPTYSQHYAGPSYAQYLQNQVPHHLSLQQLQPPILLPAQLPT